MSPICFFFSSRRRHTRFDCDWSSDVCSSDLFIKSKSAAKFELKGGRAWIDDTMWPLIRSAIETHSGGLIVDRKEVPAIALPSEEFANKDSELVACDVECRLAGIDGFYLELDVPGLDKLIGGAL